MDGASSSFDTHRFDIRSESTPKSILKKKRTDNGIKSKVLFSPTKEIKNFKDYFDSTEESISHNPRPKLDEAFPMEEERLINRILTDSNIPYVLSLYLQLIFNMIILISLSYFIIIFVRTIRSDINNKTELYVSDLLQEISKCSREFYRNKCNTNIPPVLETKCTDWSKCMNRDPQLLGKSKITAEILADILNGFVKPISWKTIFFIITIVFGSLIITNLAFNTYRHSSNVKVDQLESTIKHQQLLIQEMSSRTTHRGRTESQDYLNDLDNLDLSNPSPLAKKSLDF